MFCNCQVYTYGLQRQRGGVIVLMPSLYAGPPRNRWWWRPLWHLFGGLAQWCWYRDTGRWQHAVWAEKLGGTREMYKTLMPYADKHERGFPVFFHGYADAIDEEYWGYYGAK
jgi:hypothetical protein